MTTFGLLVTHFALAVAWYFAATGRTATAIFVAVCAGAFVWLSAIDEGL